MNRVFKPTYWDKLYLRESTKKTLTDRISPRSRMVHLDELMSLSELPSSTQIIARDFIHNSLYNPYYGYFSKEATVFSYPKKPMDFPALRNNDDFLQTLATQYQILENKNDLMQIWHTPTEIFQPYYGEALARHIVKSFKESTLTKLKIFEIGAGNGVMMKNIMEYLKVHEREIFRDTSYTIIEISERLHGNQKALLSSLATDIQQRTRLVKKSIIDWSETENEDCYFIALEVLVLESYNY
jgi:SAM-dependent MidA family methyltransferase